MQLFRRPQPRVTVAELLAWAQTQIALGVPRQAICHGWLHPDRTSLTAEERGVYQQAERQLFGEMVARNHRALELEKHQRFPEAISLYEANARDRFVGALPYQRLQALYIKQGDYDAALRISRLHARLLASIRETPQAHGNDKDSLELELAPLAPRHKFLLQEH